jgi:hypothetical protein
MPEAVPLLLVHARAGPCRSIPFISHREAEVLSFIAEGKTGLEISILLRIMHDTVRKHTSHIFEKAWSRDADRRREAGAVMDGANGLLKPALASWNRAPGRFPAVAQAFSLVKVESLTDLNHDWFGIVEQASLPVHDARGFFCPRHNPDG